MSQYVYFKPETGRIVCSYRGDETESMDEIYSDCQRLEGIGDPEKDYILNGQVTAKPKFSLVSSKPTLKADGTDAVIISGHPSGATIFVSGPSSDAWIETQSSVEITVNIPGAYRIRASLFPYLDQLVIVDAA